MSNLNFCEKCQSGYLTEDGHDCPNTPLATMPDSPLANRTEQKLRQLQGFFDDVCKRCFPSMNDLDGCDFQELAHKHGLLVEVPYDPAMHGEVDGADPGDIIYVRAS